MPRLIHTGTSQTPIVRKLSRPSGFSTADSIRVADMSDCCDVFLSTRDCPSPKEIEICTSHVG